MKPSYREFKEMCVRFAEAEQSLQSARLDIVDVLDNMAGYGSVLKINWDLIRRIADGPGRMEYLPAHVQHTLSQFIVEED